MNSSAFRELRTSCQLLRDWLKGYHLVTCAAQKKGKTPPLIDGFVSRSFKLLLVHTGGDRNGGSSGLVLVGWKVVKDVMGFDGLSEWRIYLS